MSARTRLVYFITNPYSGARAPIAALLQYDDVTHVVRASVPGLSSSAQFAVARALTDIEALHDFEVLPIGAGPHVVLGEPRTLPAGVDDPGRWVSDHLLGA